jgi:hypothetical protein
MKSMSETIALELEHIAAQICDKYCKYPEQWDKEKEGKELYESEICKNCPMSRLV